MWYDGTERVVAWLIDELIALGHQVTLFASGGSVTGEELVAAWPRALRLGRPAPTRSWRKRHCSRLRRSARPNSTCCILYETRQARKIEAPMQGGK
ncbi:MAG TPA: hypothetical protein VNZ53_55000 [Steroidobacteraceae bacterium]|nr:hypothetical protein [Steroidobacteraceae bacterium]